MSQRTVYGCDRCKVNDVPKVFHVDVGTDFTTPRAEDPSTKRIAKDLCEKCYKSLMDWYVSPPKA